MARCLHPHTILNPHYKKFESELRDSQVMPHDLWLTIPCGKCINCRKSRQSDWRTRIRYELLYGQYSAPVFVTLTFDDGNYYLFRDKPERALRLFLERYRKLYKRSCRHFFVTELGGDYGRLHFHGILFDCMISSTKHTFQRRPKKDGRYGRFLYNDGSLKEYVLQLKSLWSYGNVWVDAVRPETVNYIVKYMLKEQDVRNPLDLEFAKNFVPRVFVSPGLGKQYCDDARNLAFHFSKDDGVWFVLLDDGRRASLPRYFANKIFPEDFRKSLAYMRWLDPPPERYYLDGICYDNKYVYLEAVKVKYADSLKRCTSLPVRTYYPKLPCGLSRFYKWIANGSYSLSYLNAVQRTLSSLFTLWMPFVNMVNNVLNYEYFTSIKAQSTESLQFRPVF